ncbi:MAG: 50S ribosomal protein L2, partial [Candidatus Nanohaloarchaea archaeon]
MTKRIRSQRRGKGSPTYTSPSHRGQGEVEHREDEVSGTIRDIVHDPARTAPVAVVEFEDSAESEDSARSSESGDSSSGEERNVL